MQSFTSQLISILFDQFDMSVCVSILGDRDEIRIGIDQQFEDVRDDDVVLFVLILRS